MNDPVLPEDKTPEERKKQNINIDLADPLPYQPEEHPASYRKRDLTPIDYPKDYPEHVVEPEPHAPPPEVIDSRPPATKDKPAPKAEPVLN